MAGVGRITDVVGFGKVAPAYPHAVGYEAREKGLIWGANEA